MHIDCASGWPALLLVHAALLLTGCVTTNATPLNPTTSSGRPPTDPSQVVFYTTASQVPGAYQELSLLSTRADSIWRSEASMMDSIRATAAAVGANGVILDATSEPSAGAKVASFLFIGWDISGRKNRSVAIYLLPPSEQPLQRTAAPAAAAAVPAAAAEVTAAQPASSIATAAGDGPTF